MSLENVCNESMILSVNEIGTTATLTILTPAKPKVKAGGSGVYAGDIDVAISLATNGTCTQTPPVPPAPFPKATLKPTATKTKAQGDLVLRDGDSAVAVTISGTDGGGNPCTFPVTVVVTDAGQTKVKAQ
jgi:hypothetical protein